MGCVGGCHDNLTLVSKTTDTLNAVTGPGTSCCVWATIALDGIDEPADVEHVTVTE